MVLLKEETFLILTKRLFLWFVSVRLKYCDNLFDFFGAALLPDRELFFPAKTGISFSAKTAWPGAVGLEIRMFYCWGYLQCRRTQVSLQYAVH